MPLLDHFRPPVGDLLPWSSLFHGWAVRLADVLCERLSEDFIAEEHLVAAGKVDFDVGSYRRPHRDDPAGAYTGDLTPDELAGWVPPHPDGSIPAVFPDRFEVQVRHLAAARQLVSVVAFVCPTHKAGTAQGRVFVERVVSFLRGGVSVVLLDIVAHHAGNLHNEIARVIDVPADLNLPDFPSLYAAAYRPALRNKQPVIDVWLSAFTVGDPLPTMPLRLTGELFVPVEFEATYTEACRRRRLI